MTHTVVIAASWLSLISGFFIPLVTGLITKKVSSSKLKSACTTVLSVVAGVVATAQGNDGHIILEPAVTNVMVAFVTAITTYYGLHRPVGSAEAVQNIAPKLGIGKAA